MDTNFRKRLKRRLYYGGMTTDLDTPSLPLTELTVEYFRDSVSQELGHIDLDMASDIVRKNHVSPCSVVMSLLYAKRLRQRSKPYLESISSTDVFFISMMMASKYMYDEGVDEEVFNDEWADSIEQEVDDVNQMETEFLDAMDWRLFTRPNEFESVLCDIERRLALREGIRRGWFTYAEMSVLADWNLFNQLWNNVGLECSKLSVILSATYVTSLLSLLGTTAIAIQMSIPMSTAVVSGLSNHLVPAVMDGWQSLPYFLAINQDYQSIMKHHNQLDYSFEENQSDSSPFDSSETMNPNHVELKLPTVEEDTTVKSTESSSDFQTSARSTSLLSILFLDSLLSQIWSVQSSIESKKKAEKRNPNGFVGKDEHSDRLGRSGLKERRNNHQNETGRHEVAQSDPANSLFDIDGLTSIFERDELVDKMENWPNTETKRHPHTCFCSPSGQRTKNRFQAIKQGCSFMHGKATHGGNRYDVPQKNVDLLLPLHTGSPFLHLPHDLHTNLRTKIT